MSSLFSLIGLYEELLLEGSFRSVGFSHVLGDDEPGRRVQEFLFPGQDAISYQDLGVLDRDIVVKGIMSGDDFIAQGQRMREALWTAGPGTLVSPWLGTIQVVQAPGKQPKISFDHTTLRICTFTATFRRYVAPVISTPNIFQQVLNGLSDLRTAAIQMLTSVLAPIALTLAAVSQVKSLMGEVESIFGQLIPSCPSPQVAAAAVTPLALLPTVAAAPLDITYGVAVAALLAGPTAAIAGTTTPLIPAAVAPGGSTVTPVAVDGRITATLILAAVAQLDTVTLSGAPIQIAPGPSLVLCAQCFFLADAVQAASDIVFDSQQEAIVWRDQVTAALDAAIVRAQLLVPTSAAIAAALWRGMIAARAAWIADMNDTIGSLPSVAIFTPPGQAPVWALAQFLAGDDPGVIVATYRDLITRNGIYHPAEPPAGPLEVLA